MSSASSSDIATFANSAYDSSAPFIELDPDAGKLYLVLPPVAGPWLIDAGFDTFRIHPEVDRQGQPLTQRVSIVQPTARIKATAAQTGATYRLAVLCEDFPLVSFGPHGAKAASYSCINAQPAFLLAPTSTTFTHAANAADNAAETEPGTAVAMADEIRFSSWPEWSLYELPPLGAGDEIELKFRDQSTRLRVPDPTEALTTEIAWLDETGRIHDVRGTDGKPIFHTSPQLVLPAGDEGTWTIELYYLDPDSTTASVAQSAHRELVEELVDLAEFRGTPLALFADVYEDAWVGRYEVDVLCDGLLVERRTYNMAESFDLHVTYSGVDGAQFRHPDQKADATAYTKAYFAERVKGDKLIEVPFSRPQAIERNEESKSFSITNAVGYSLEIVVAPKALRFALGLRGEQPEWLSRPTSVALDALSKNGEFKICFPGGIGGTAVLLLTHEVSRKVKVIALKRRRHGAVFTTTNASIRSAFKDAHASLIATVAWHPEDSTAAWATFQADPTGSAAFASQEEFEKAYATHTTPDVQLATLARLTETAGEFDALITGDTLRLSGPTVTKGLTCFLWPATRPDIAPWRVQLGAQLSVTLPEELVAAGPLVIDIAESSPGFSAKAPARPSGRCAIAQQSGHFDEADGAALAWKLSPANERTVFAKKEHRALWRHLYALRNVDAAHMALLAPMPTIVRKTINSDPRHMLEALGRSNVRVGDQPALAIAHGLPNYDFHFNGERVVDFRATGWVRVLEQLNDLADGRLSTPEDLADATDFLDTQSSGTLLALLRGEQDVQQLATPSIHALMQEVIAAAEANSLSNAIESLNDIGARRGVADDAALRHGWFELLRHRRKFEDIPGFTEFRAEMSAQEANIPVEGVRRHLALLRKFGATYGQRQRNWWAWGPYMSAVSAYVARAAAAEKKGLKAYFYPLKSEQLRVWADIAQLAPTLTAFDLTRAEACQLATPDLS